jgi:RNA polymerase sigma-70 factor (ECF subfamily)
VVKDEFWAEEVVQESFIKVFRNLKSFKGRSSFKTWFYRIVINEAFKHVRDEKKQVIYKDEISDMEMDSVEEGLDGLNSEEQMVLVQQALKEIAPKESLALRLFYLEGQNTKTIADETGWSEGNVRIILYRARKNMLVVVKKLLLTEFKIEKYGPR